MDDDDAYSYHYPLKCRRMKNFLSFEGLKEVYARRMEPENLHRLAGIYWVTIVLLAATVVAASVTFGFWEMLASEAVTSEGASGGGIVGFNREQLDTLVKTFQKQKTDFEQLMTR